MKKSILIIITIIYSFRSMAGEPPSHFACFSDHKVETPSGRGEVEYPWKTVEIPVIFDWNNKKLIICARDTFFLTVGSVGEHYLTKEGDNGLDFHATDQLGRRVTCTYVILKNKTAQHSNTLVVRYVNVYLVYKMLKID